MTPANVKRCDCLRSQVYDSRKRGHMRWRRVKCLDCGRRWTTRRFPGADRVDGPTSVYFIRAGDMLKIGVAKNTARRISALQQGAPVKLELVLEVQYESCSQARERERAIHADLRDHHARGEWFYETPAVAQYVAGMASKAKTVSISTYV